MNKDAVVLRVNYCKGYDFVEEHNRVLINGKVWVLKLGKVIPEWRLKKLMEESGWIVFRTEKNMVHGSIYLNLLTIMLESQRIK